MKKIVVAAIIIKTCVALLYCFVGFVHPHMIRQNVTIAVSQRFAIDWQYHDKDYPWLPRSLAGGDHDGILEMEFPLLNYLTAPAFYLETPTARILSRLLSIILNLSLWFVHYRLWRKIKILGMSCEIPALSLLLLPISGMYFHRFMPDFLSLILCSTAVGLSIRFPEKIVFPLILGALGLLEKPTAIIAFGPLLLLENPLRQIRQRLKWVIPSLLIAMTYYTLGTKWIRSLSDLDRYYATDLRNPIKSIVDFFSQPYSALKLFFRELTPPYLPLVLFAVWIWQKFPSVDRSVLKLWALFAAQILSVVILDGSHSFIHSYYYIGLSMTAGLIWLHYLQKFHTNKVIQFLLIAPILIFNLEHSFYELRDGIFSRADSATSLWKDCSLLKSRHPDWPWNSGYSFHSEISPISEIGVCFGEIQSSKKNKYGFFWLDQAIPINCEKIDQEGLVSLTECKPE